MAQIITTPDGENNIVMDLRDFTDLIDQYLGSEARCWLEGYLSDTYSDEDETQSIMDYYEKKLEEKKAVMAEIRAEAEKLAGLICQKDLDRKAVSNTAGRIGAITWREVNRP